ncbi:putative leucine-rich repeat-containing protein DDB_G0290503, partial [Adelges cooleyi]|uniref:putative leucine-rich repeat-containing protein DDB_G0290503 n=1 Tax=Adelges cooleyi TaxID=133065 RepID=UPI0021806334
MDSLEENDRLAIVNENNFVHMENNILNHTLDKNVSTLRIKGVTICDQILKDVDKLKENVLIQNLKIADQEKENIIIKSENEENNLIIQLLQHHFLQDPSKFNWLSDQVSTLQEKSYIEKELFDGKLLIVEEINQIEGINAVSAEGFNGISAENSNLSDLIHILLRTIFEKKEYLHNESRQQLQYKEDQNQQLTKELEDLKEWQNHIENENEKLLNEIEEYKQNKIAFMNNKNELYELKECLHKTQATIDQYHKEAKTLKRLLNERQNELNEKDIRYNDATELINLLRSNLAEQTKNNEEMCLSYHEEREKRNSAYNEIESASKELTIRVHEKNDMVTMLQEENCNLQHEMLLSRTHIENFNIKIELLENNVREKTQTIQKLQESKSSLKQNENSSYFMQELNHL